MTKRTRMYRCSKCRKIVLRTSDKRWIKSMCENLGNAAARLIIVNDPHKRENRA